MSLNQSKDIIKIARGLNLPYKRSPIKEIIKFCKTQVQSWIRIKNVQINTLNELLEFVTNELKIKFELFNSESELNQLIDKYLAHGEYVFNYLRKDFENSDIFATTIRLDNCINGKRFIAIIDSRGSKKYRLYFSKWHEIAHVLCFDPQMELSFQRSTKKNSPKEQLMDIIAGEIGFFDPIFLPFLESELIKITILMLMTIQVNIGVIIRCDVIKMAYGL